MLHNSRVDTRDDQRSSELDLAKFPGCDRKADLLPNFTLIGALGTELKLLDDTLSSSHMKEWQMALDHEICQLEKLRTWVIEDLSEGCTVISHNKVLKEKHGPDGEIAFYKVQIVAGGHN